MSVVFRESDHTYWQGNTRLPSVTEVLKPLMGDLRFVKADVLEWKSALGTAVHKAIELHLCNDLEYSSLDQEVALYFDQFLAFQRDTGFTERASELRVSHALGYAGTLDCVGEFNRKVGLIDWKCTSVISPVVALQTAAYALAHDAQHVNEVPVNGNRFALRLARDKYRLHRYPSHQFNHDITVFKSLLTMHRWCESNNKTLEIPE